MSSWSFIEGFIADNNIAVEVYAADGWDKTSNKLQINDDIYDVKKQEWLLENKGPPSSWTLFKAFSDHVTVIEDNKSGLVAVSMEFYSPHIAKDWLDLYVAAINQHMQARKVAKVSKNIAYLQAQIEKTSIAKMQEVFYAIIEEQIKNKMLADASPDYAFVSVGQSMVPEKKSRPKRALICILGTLLGGMLSVLVVLAMHYARNSD
jgi:LPS O-antigen subunit length determinant protein (WzzB/FepE family)